MSRQWKPGDVALLLSHEARVRVGIKGHGPNWYTQDDMWAPNVVDEARPLVVIDPEDREQVRALANALPMAAKMHVSVDDVQGALRSLAAPPKPDEPTGLGAVVEDAEGEQWCRWDIDRPKAHPKPWAVAGAIKGNRAYADIAAVKVLSEGVTR